MEYIDAFDALALGRETGTSRIIVASAHRLPMYPVQLVILAILALLLGALLLSLTLWFLG